MSSFEKSAMSSLKPKAVAQPLYWWSSAELAEMARRLHPLWEAWLRDWATQVDTDSMRVECIGAVDGAALPAGTWSPLGSNAGAMAWTQVAGDVAAPGGSLLFGPFGVGGRPAIGQAPIAGAVWREAESELLQALRRCLGVTGDDRMGPPGEQLFKPWAGAVVVSFGSGIECGIQLLLNPQALLPLLTAFKAQAAQMPAQAPALAELCPVEAAVSGYGVQIQVTLKPCELDLGTLSELRLGDIIPLPHSLDAPLIVSLGRDALCAGFLGRRGAARAIELASAANLALATEIHYRQSP